MANTRRENETRANLARSLARELWASSLPGLAERECWPDVLAGLHALSEATSLTERQYGRLVVRVVADCDALFDTYAAFRGYTVRRYLAERIAGAEREAAPESAWSAFPQLYPSLVAARQALLAVGLA